MAWYKDGQVTVQSGSRAVVGAGTAWLKQVMVGEGLDVLDGRLHEVAEVISNTELLLVDAYAGASAAGIAYQIIPSASMTKELTRRVNLLVATHEEMTAGVGQAYTATLQSAAQVAAAAQQVEGNTQVAEQAAHSAGASQVAAHEDSDAAMGYRNEARAARDGAGAEAAAAALANDGAQLAVQQAQAARDAAAAFAESVDPVALRDRANHTGTQSIETVDGLSGALASLVEAAAKALQQTSTTGAALLPEGLDAQRPAAGSIPADALLIRGNTQAPADYKPEFWDRAMAVWKTFADRSWVGQQISAAVNVVEGWVNQQIGFTIIYPNGGSSGSPANIAANSRYVIANPFPGYHVLCVVELLIGGNWGDPGWDGNTGAASPQATGVRSGWFSGSDSVVVQTGSAALTSNSSLVGNVHGITPGAGITTAPCRVKVWKCKGGV